MKYLLIALIGLTACTKANKSTSTLGTCTCRDEQNLPVRYEYNVTQSRCDSATSQFSAEAQNGCQLSPE